MLEVRKQPNTFSWRRKEVQLSNAGEDKTLNLVSVNMGKGRFKVTAVKALHSTVEV